LADIVFMVAMHEAYSSIFNDNFFEAFYDESLTVEQAFMLVTKPTDCAQAYMDYNPLKYHADDKEFCR